MTLKTRRTKDRPETGYGAPKTLAALNAMIAASPPLLPGASRAVLREGPVGASIAFVGGTTRRSARPARQAVCRTCRPTPRSVDSLGAQPYGDGTVVLENRVAHLC